MSSQIQIATTLKHSATGLTVQSARTYTASENEAAFIPTEVTTTPESIDYGNIVSVKAVAVKVTGGDDVLVSLDGGSSYPLRIELNGGGAVPK